MVTNEQEVEEHPESCECAKCAEVDELYQEVFRLQDEVERLHVILGWRTVNVSVVLESHPQSSERKSA